MTYTQADRDAYPTQGMDELLLQFAAEVMTRREYAETIHSDGLTFAEWDEIDPNQTEVDATKQRMKPLITAGMLTWPVDTTDLGVFWEVLGPGQYRGMNAAPGLPWIQLFGYDARGAIDYARANRMLHHPHTLSWKWRS